MKREAIVVRCSCVSSRSDQLNKASIYKLLDVFAGGSLLDSKGFHLERGELKITTSSCFICGQNVQISCSNAQRGEFFIEQERVAYLDKALLPAIRGCRQPPLQWFGTLTFCHDLLFTKWNGEPIDPKTVTSWFPGFLASHDLPAVHFHSLRHTNASLLIAAHAPITTVSGRLGHAQTSTTLNIYASAIQSADAAAADALEGIIRIREQKHA